MARVRFAWESLRSSLWAIPLSMAALGAGLAMVAVNLRLPEGVELEWIFGGTSASAREFAASLVSAMITLTALAFSITMVVLTLAAQQLGPRLIRAFMSDRKTKLALGLFLGTVVYLVLVLRTLDGADETSTPSLAITAGTALVLASVIVLLFFVHWLARSIVADNVIARVGATLDAEIDALTRDEDQAGTRAVATPAYVGGVPLRPGVSGYIQSIDHGAIVDLAREGGVRLVLERRTGDHVLADEAIGRFDRPCDQRLCQRIAAAILIGGERTQGQDPDWSVRQLVEVALRALSSGINDEYTAVAVLHRLAQSLARMASLAPPRRIWTDDDREVRLASPVVGFDELVQTAVEPIRATSTSDARMLRHLAITICRLSHVVPAAHRPSLQREADILLETARRSHTATVELEGIERAIAAMRDAPG